MVPKRPYHHGNLKPALLEAAVALIGEVGPAAFTLREVARRAGISHNAPYRHFREKDELLAAVATEGFHRLADALGADERETDVREANAQGKDAQGKHAQGKDAIKEPQKGRRVPRAAALALRRFHASGIAYVRFGLRSPEHLFVMFDWPLAPDRYPELSAAAKRAFSILVGLVEAAQREGALPAGDPLGVACMAWSLVHGIAKLAIARRLPFKTESEILGFTAHAIEALHQGLAPKGTRA